MKIVQHDSLFSTFTCYTVDEVRAATACVCVCEIEREREKERKRQKDRE